MRYVCVIGIRLFLRRKPWVDLGVSHKSPIRLACDNVVDTYGVVRSGVSPKRARYAILGVPKTYLICIYVRLRECVLCISRERQQSQAIIILDVPPVRDAKLACLSLSSFSSLSGAAGFCVHQHEDMFHDGGISCHDVRWPLVKSSFASSSLLISVGATLVTHDKSDHMGFARQLHQSLVDALSLPRRATDGPLLNCTWYDRPTLTVVVEHAACCIRQVSQIG